MFVERSLQLVFVVLVTVLTVHLPQSLEEVMMSAREPLEWYFKLLDQSVGLSFKG